MPYNIRIIKNMKHLPFQKLEVEIMTFHWAHLMNYLYSKIFRQTVPFVGWHFLIDWCAHLFYLMRKEDDEDQLKILLKSARQVLIRASFSTNDIVDDFFLSLSRFSYCHWVYWNPSHVTWRRDGVEIGEC